MRIGAVLAIVAGIPFLLYWLWSPGTGEECGRLDRGQNAIWLGHGWLGDDSWFQRNSRNVNDFRSVEKVERLAQQCGLSRGAMEYMRPAFSLQI